MKKEQEVIQYIVWGIISAVLNVTLFQMLNRLGIDYRVANGITLVVVKIFSYLTNKFFVFCTPFIDLGNLIKEACSFFVARGATFLLEFVGVILLVEIIKWTALQSKCIMAVIVIVLNYLLSKKFVFYKR